MQLYDCHRALLHIHVHGISRMLYIRHAAHMGIFFISHRGSRLARLVKIALSEEASNLKPMPLPNSSLITSCEASSWNERIPSTSKVLIAEGA